MPNPHALSETAQRILGLLEEAGEEEICLTMNTIFMPPRTEKAVDELIASLLVLVNSGYARMAQVRAPKIGLVNLDIEASIAAVLAIPTYIKFVPEGPYWVDTRSIGPPYPDLLPNIVLTDDGFAKARQILTARGWEWWVPRAKK